jgi:hypothetical protein
MVKRYDGSLVSARTRFARATATAGARAATANPQAVHANAVSTDPSYSCPGICTVITLDRQTLQEKTAAPEKPPNCVSNGTSLKRCLATLNGDDLVIVGSKSIATPARNGGGEIQS